MQLEKEIEKMGKILATTDFSANSKAGLRFAIQLARQNKSEITFFYVYNNMSPTSRAKERIASFEKEEEKKLQEQLNRFVDKIYKDMGVNQKHKDRVVNKSLFSDTAIMQYAEENMFDFICISTRGAGKVERFLGTNTSNLICNSSVPVIAVPYNYRTRKIEKILYASDLVHLLKELEKVVAFTKPLKAKLELLHFTSPAEPFANEKVLDAAVAAFSNYEVKLNIKNIDYVKTLVGYIEAAIKEIKPSMLIMFTEQHRTMFQKIFLPSKSASYSFHSKIPLLVYNKS